MKKQLTREFTYLFSSIIIVLIAFHFRFDLTNFKQESVLDINLHDTYFVIEKIELLSLFALIFLYIIYLIKVVIEKFKNNLTLWIYSIISLILIIIFPSLLSFVKSLAVEPGWIVYPPLSAPESQVEVKKNMFNTIYTILYYIYIIVTISGIVGVFKLGRVYKRHSL